MPKTDDIVEESNPAEDLSQMRIYNVRFKKGTGAVKELHFLALDDNDAKKKALKFCAKHSFHHILTKPFLTDLESEFTI